MKLVAVLDVISEWMITNFWRHEVFGASYLQNKIEFIPFFVLHFQKRECK
jgi:hypothetical protein